MKKINSKKSILIFFVLAFLALLTVGCSSIIGDQTGIVNIHVVSGMILGKIMVFDPTYDIHMDGFYIGTTDDLGNLVIPDVPVGWHNFEAVSNYEHGSKGQSIKPGMNYVTIYATPSVVII